MSCLCIITALPAESRPFIDALKLRHISDHGWRQFARGDYILLQTGLGKLKAAAATSALLHTHPEVSAVINVGIGGASESIGSTFLAHRITDKGSGAYWYPHLPPQSVVNHMATTSLITCDSPRSDYQPQTTFDMEASGLMSAAAPYLSTDAIQSIKVVSDNSESSLKNINPADVSELIQTAVPVVLNLSQWYLDRTAEQTSNLGVISLCEELTNSAHYTTHERHQLLRLLHQYKSLLNELPRASELLKLHSAKAIRQHLNKAVQTAPLHYGDKI